MTTRRTFMLAAAGATAVTLALAGCSASSSSTTASATYTAPSKDTKATLSYAIWDQNQAPVMQKIIDDFNEEYPDITVKLTVTPSDSNEYWTKLNTQAQSGTLPDVFWMSGPNVRLYASNGQLASLDGVVDAKAIDPSDYPSSLDSIYTVDDHLYGVPKDFDTVGLYYNKKLLKEAGAALPTDDWTWNDVQTEGAAVSKALHAEGAYGFSGDISFGQQSWYNTVAQAGGQIISANGKKSGYDSAATIEGLQFWRDAIASGASPSVQQLSTSKASEWFTSGKLAMVYAGDWETTPFKDAIGDDLGVVKLPAGPKNADSVIHGLANVVSAKSEHPDAAKAFAAFLGGKEAAEEQSKAGLVIPALNGSQSAYAKSMPGLDLQLFLDQADSAAVYPISNNTGAWNTLETEILGKAFAGQEPVKDAAKELATKMNALLAKEH
jgi:multiple sugar transport system substrate-binding protein